MILGFRMLYWYSDHLKISNKIIGMGCQSIAPVIPQATRHTLYGIISIHLRTLHLEGQHSKSSKAGSILIKMTNQSFKTKPIIGEEVSESVDFIVNSRYQKYGRSLVVQAFKDGLVSESSVGLGITDLQFIIREKKKEVQKVYLNHQSKPVGWVEIEASFEQYPTFPITLLFDSALIRRKTSKFAAIKCKIRATIGEEVLQTKVCEDKEDQPPTWRTQQMTFFVLKDKTKEGKVEILDGQVLIGHITINLQQVYTSTESLIELNEQFHFKEDIVAGTIKFTISKAENIHIKDSQPKKSVFVTPSKKKLPPLNLPETAASKEKQSQVGKMEEPRIQHAVENPIHVKPKDNKLQEQQRRKKEEQERKLKEIAELKAQEEAKLLKEQEEKKIKQEKQKLEREEQNRKLEEAKRLKEEQEKEAKIAEEKRLKQLEQAKLQEQAQKQRIKAQQAKKAKEQEEKRKHQEEKKAKEAEQARIKEEQAKKLKEEQERKLKQEQQRKHKEEQAKKLKEQQEAKKLKEEQAKKLIEEQQAKKLKEEEEARQLKQKQEEERKKKELEEDQKIKKAKEAQQLKKKQQEKLLAKAHQEEEKKKEEAKKVQEENKRKQQHEHEMKQLQEQKAKEEAQRKKLAQQTHEKVKETVVETQEPTQTKIEEVKQVKEETPPQHSQKPIEKTEQTEQHP